MANPVSILTGSVSIVQAIINLALKIKEKVDTFWYNREDCRKIGELVATVRDVAEGLRKTTEKEDGGAMLGGALEALKQALERAWHLVVACQRKNAVLRFVDDGAIAVKLRRVYLDISLNLSAVVLANGAYNTSKLADINGIVAALRADVAYNTWMVAKILEIVAALPEALLHLQQQVAILVQSFSDSTDDDASYYQNKSTWETKKTDDVARYSTTYSSSNTYNTYAYPVRTYGETKKTDDVGRYSTTYSSSNTYAYVGSSYVEAVRDRSHLKQVMAKANEKLLVLEFMGSKSYRSTCEYMKPILDGIAAKKDAYFYTIDVDNDPFKEIANRENLQALPTFWIVKGNKKVRCLVAPDEKELSSSIEDALKAK